MAKYVCTVCGGIYDEDIGEPYKSIKPGTKWEDLPYGYNCQLCGVTKEYFRKLED